jgi:hypothetical protein
MGIVNLLSAEVKHHGALYSLKYTVTNKKSAKTLQTEENINVFIDEIEELVKSEKDSIQWFDNGMCQAGTTQELETIHVYDAESKLIVIFKKSTGDISLLLRKMLNYS